jgi:fatty acid desaturase
MASVTLVAPACDRCSPELAESAEIAVSDPNYKQLRSLVSDARRWTKILAPYRQPNHLRSALEIAVTLVPLVALWVMAWTALHFGCWWLCLLLTMPAAFFLVRLFMIQHDCGHGSFFHHRTAND